VWGVRHASSVAEHDSGCDRTRGVEASGQSEQELREKAVESLKKKRDFKTHVLI
jgi:hypothetical protein